MAHSTPLANLPPALENPHAKTSEQVLAELQVSGTGLSSEEAARRQAVFGPNTFGEVKPRTLWHWIISQFKDRLVIMLLVASLLSLYLGGYRDATVLLGIVFGNILAGIYQEWKADKILQSLRSLVVHHCVALRDGRQAEIAARDLVPGDIVVVREGDIVPADLRLLETSRLAASEFVLTGESVPSEKQADTLVAASAAMAERHNLLFQGTAVVRGIATGVVTASGGRTVVGALAAQTQELQPPESVLQQAINRMADQLSIFAVSVGVGAFLFIWALGDPVANAIIFAIGLAAALVPSGLATEVTIGMALGVRRMASKKAVVKQLQAVEAIGAASVIATDKTGTLTENKMLVTRLHLLGEDWFITGNGYAPKGEVLTNQLEPITAQKLPDLKLPIAVGYLASEGTIHPPDATHNDWYAIGDPTDSAFATLAMKAGWALEELQAQYPILQAFPFDPDRKRMSIVRTYKGQQFSFVKGSIEALLERSKYIADKEGLRPLEQDDKERLTELADLYSAEAMRIIAVAERVLPQGVPIDEQLAESELTLLGFAAMQDPPRQGVDDAVREALEAGIRLVMITGDNGVTARAIAQQVGMQGKGGGIPTAIHAHDLVQLPDEAFDRHLRESVLLVYRTAPDDKLKIVERLQSLGDVVAATGDGVNDTLSLKKADVGVAMGESGTRLAQDVAEIVLLNDNFRTIVEAVREGRLISRNIRNTIAAVLSSNMAELICMIYSLILMGLGGDPITLAIHILLVDFIAEMIPLLAMMFDKPPDDLMRRPPVVRSVASRGLIGPQSIATGFLRGLWAIGMFYLIRYINEGDPAAYDKAVTSVFAIIVLTQYVNLIVIRGLRYTISYMNVYLYGSVFFSIGLFVTMLYVPAVSAWLHTAPLSYTDWAILVGSLVVFYFPLAGVAWLIKRRDTANFN